MKRTGLVWDLPYIMINRCSAERGRLDGKGPGSELSSNSRIASLTEGIGSLASSVAAMRLKADAFSASHSSVLHGKGHSISKIDMVGGFLKHTVRKPSARKTQEASRIQTSSVTNALHVTSSPVQTVGGADRFSWKIPKQRIRDTRLG